MTGFPLALHAPVRAWRIDQQRHAGSWDSGIGAQAAGGRWNPRGVKCVYCALDPATAIVEVAVHKGFAALDATPNVLTAMDIADPSLIRVVTPADVPNPHWLVPGIPSAGQQTFGASLLASHAFVAFPSVVSKHSWNILFDPDRARPHYSLALQEALSIDPRLNPPAAAPS